MKTKINGNMTAITLAIASSVFAMNTYAASINLDGSSTIGASGATITGKDLSNPGTIKVNTPFYGTNTGDFSPFPSLASGGKAAFFNVGTFDLANMTSFNITGPAPFGSYAVTFLQIISESANFLNVYTSGYITPGTIEGTEVGGCATAGNTCAKTNASLRWSFTESGSSVSASGTFNSPGIPVNKVPEPAVLGLILAGLAGWKMSQRQPQNKFVAKALTL